ncbi:TlpA family protein disulfide reductase [Parenemella sanctibonifatiensis]|uniref:Thioredoxin n=1 Tax=Parenemella sanctibonifatiensis TaxID=2016505 RepID=A0A255DZ12_9ACTN|nr:TlpA disulfide reductase family protein [Parenemella sanctibonifatiensis]OYN84579.1 thioredoxin [Parenemella sanctibonifatiensis]
MRAGWRAAAGLALAAALLTGCLPTPDRGADRSPASSAPVDLGQEIAACPSASGPGELPALQLTCLGGNSEVSLNQLRGPLVVNVWASWCGPCRQEAPFLAEVSEEYADRVTFLGVIVEDDPALATEFAQAADWRYAHVLDPQGRFLAELGRSGVPQTLLVSASGEIVRTHPGAFSSAQQLRELLAELD